MCGWRRALILCLLACGGLPFRCHSMVLTTRLAGLLLPHALPPRTALLFWRVARSGGGRRARRLHQPPPTQAEGPLHRHGQLYHRVCQRRRRRRGRMHVGPHELRSKRIRDDRVERPRQALKRGEQRVLERLRAAASRLQPLNNIEGCSDGSPRRVLASSVRRPLQSAQGALPAAGAKAAIVQREARAAWSKVRARLARARARLEELCALRVPDRALPV